MENHISATPSPSKLHMDGATSGSTSFLAVPQASANDHECMHDGETSCELRDSMERQTREQRKDSRCFVDCLVECRIHCSSAEMKASLGDNGTKIDQDNVSLRNSQMIRRLRWQEREPATPYSPISYDSNHEQIINPVSGRSGTHFDERTAGDQGALTCVCKAFSRASFRAEVEEFLGGVEHCEQKLLAERYNFDFQNDVPLQGRYEWIRSTHP